MPHTDSNCDKHDRTPVASAAILLGIYVAMYVAVAAMMHVVSPPDAGTLATVTAAVRANSAVPSTFLPDSDAADREIRDGVGTAAATGSNCARGDASLTD